MCQTRVTKTSTQTSTQTSRLLKDNQFHLPFFSPFFPASFSPVHLDPSLFSTPSPPKQALLVLGLLHPNPKYGKKLPLIILFSKSFN